MTRTMVVLRHRSRSPCSSRRFRIASLPTCSGSLLPGVLPLQGPSRRPASLAHRSPPRRHPKMDDETELRSAPDSRRNAGGGPARRLAGGSAVMQRPTGLHLEGSPTTRGWLACRASTMAEAIGATPRIGTSQARWARSGRNPFGGSFARESWSRPPRPKPWVEAHDSVARVERVDAAEVCPKPKFDESASLESPRRTPAIRRPSWGF